MGDFKKTYLGDGVYLTCDGHHLVLTTSNGIEDTNVIYLEPHMLKMIEKYLEEIKKGKT